MTPKFFIFLDDRGYLDPFQSGFLFGFGTETTLVVLVGDLHRELNKQIVSLLDRCFQCLLKTYVFAQAFPDSLSFTSLKSSRFLLYLLLCVLLFLAGLRLCFCFNERLFLFRLYTISYLKILSDIYVHVFK